MHFFCGGAPKNTPDKLSHSLSLLFAFFETHSRIQRYQTVLFFVTEVLQ